MSSAELALPDTRLVGEALATARRALPASIVDHSVRAYLLAEAYARKTSRAHDEEGLCVAAIFHDVGLGAGRIDGAAFTHASSAALARFLEERGVPAERIAPLADAILFHMQLLPRWSKGNVVGLLQVGAWMDAAGLRRGSVAADAERIAALFPRGDFDRAFRRSFVSSLASPSACAGLLFPSAFRERARAASA